MAGGDYLWHRKIHQGVGGYQVIGTTGVSGAVVLSGATGTASGAIFVQRIRVLVTTGAAVTWQFQDSSGFAITPPLDMGAVNTPFQFDFGDRGQQLSTGASLQISGSASGAGAIVNWEGFKKYMGGTSVGVFPASGASGTTP